jgi:GDPmannose 4,6-dehydratase
VCSYSRAKVNIEKALNVFLTKGELDSSTLILYNHESFLRKPTFFTMKVISSVYNYINHGSPFPILYNKDSEIDMGYAPEYCYIISKVASLRLFGTYIISSGTTIVVKDFVSRVFQFFGSDYEVVYKKAPPRCTARLCGDNSKLLTDVGLKPLVTGSKLVDTLCRDFILNLQPNL